MKKFIKKIKYKIKKYNIDEISKIELDLLKKTNKLNRYHIFDNEDEIRKWTDDNYKDIKYNKYCKNDKEIPYRRALYNYTGNVASNINEFLRTGKGSNEYIDNQIKEIDSIMSQYKLKENIVTFRYEKYEVLKKEKIKKDRLIEYKSFMSTTLLKNNRISHSIDNEDEIIIMIIKVPAKVQCISLCNVSESSHELELLIDRGNKIVIEDVLYKNKRNLILLCKIVDI